MERMKEYTITGMDEVPNTSDPDNYIFVLDGHIIFQIYVTNHNKEVF